MRLLVVDDEESIRITFSATLRAAGYQVEVAEDVERAKEVLRGGGIDAVLTDVVMPHVRGTALLAELRERSPEVLVLLMTGQPDIDTAIEAVRRGAFDFVVKPVERSTLLMVMRRAEELHRLSRERARLEAEVAAQNVELKARNVELERVQRAREEQLGFLVHDLKNPLTAVGANLEYLADDLTLPEGSRHAIDDAQLAVRRLREMISDILDVGKSADGQLVPRRERFAIQPLVAEVVARHVTRARARHCTVTAETDPAVVEVDADPELVRRTLANLVENALHYAGPGARITISVACDAAGARITVADDGPGIPAELRERIFDPYQRGGSQHPNGQGLGLTFCRVAAAAHGGSIRVVPNQPRGSRFEVSLPKRTG